MRDEVKIFLADNGPRAKNRGAISEVERAYSSRYTAVASALLTAYLTRQR